MTADREDRGTNGREDVGPEELILSERHLQIDRPSLDSLSLELVERVVVDVRSALHTLSAKRKFKGRRRSALGREVQEEEVDLDGSETHLVHPRRAVLLLVDRNAERLSPTVVLQGASHRTGHSSVCEPGASCEGAIDSWVERTTASTSVMSNLDDWLSWEAQAMPAAPAPTTNTRLGLEGSDIRREREAGIKLDRGEPWAGSRGGRRGA